MEFSHDQGIRGHSAEREKLLSSKPQQPQEWTPELVRAMLLVQLPNDCYQYIADAHNAALAAEREKHDRLLELFKQLGQQTLG
jgi:hypothetical protein